MGKLFLKIILGVLIIVLAGGVGYLTLTRQKIQQEVVNLEKTEVKDYSTQPIMECVDCVNGKTFENKPCCVNGFKNECDTKNGVVRTQDLHPIFTVLRGCFQKAPDAGKSCASAKDCLSGVCDLTTAISSGKCKLEDSILDKNIYNCNTVAPGICAEARENIVNPGGGKIHSFEMENKTLIETLAPGPTY